MKQICGSIRRLVVTVMIFTSLYPCAVAEQAAYESGDFRYILRDDGAQITGLTDDRKNLLCIDSPLFIPDTLDGHSVVSIGEGAFTGIAMSDVQIPDSIVEICARAFEYCAIKSINIPKSVKSLGMRAFANCYQLEDIIIPENVECIGESAFEACNNLMSVTLSNGVRNASDYAFRNCAQLTTVMIGESVEKIGINPFVKGHNLQSYVSMLHAFLKAKGHYLFDSQTGKLLSYTGTFEEDSFTVPEEITHIGIASFYGVS